MLVGVSDVQLLHSIAVVVPMKMGAQCLWFILRRSPPGRWIPGLRFARDDVVADMVLGFTPPPLLDRRSHENGNPVSLVCLTR